LYQAAIEVDFLTMAGQVQVETQCTFKAFSSPRTKDSSHHISGIYC